MEVEAGCRGRIRIRIRRRVQLQRLSFHIERVGQGQIDAEGELRQVRSVHKRRQGVDLDVAADGQAEAARAVPDSAVAKAEMRRRREQLPQIGVSSNR